MSYDQMYGTPLAEKTATFNKHAEDYAALLRSLQSTMVRRLESSRRAVFRTSPKMKGTPLMDQAGIEVDAYLNDIYLAAMPDEDQRQHHSCTCCRRFINNFGALVTIDAEGKTHSLFFDAETFPKDNYFYTAVERLQEVIERAPVIGIHRSSSTVWGTQDEGGYTHMSAIPPVDLIYRREDKSAKQAQLILKEDFNRMAEELAKPYLSVDNLTQLKRVLDSEVLQGDEKIQGAGMWLYRTAVDRAEAKSKTVKDNLLWRAIGSALPGYTHPNSTMVGTVLDDIVAGKSFESIQKRFAAKTRPDVYRQQTAAPTVNHLEVAEKLVEKLGIAPAMRRRVATFEDIQDRAFVWRKLIKPTLEVKEVKPATVFGHLHAKNKVVKKELALPASKMSWNKFVAEILPHATDLEIYIPESYDYFSGFLTQADPEAKPILAYDLEEDRNPVSIYQRYTQVQENIYAPKKMMGVQPEVWGLESGAYHPVKGVIKAPHQWGDTTIATMGNLLIFLIDGGWDKMIENGVPGLALFPQLLKQELFEIERAMTAFSNAGKVEGDVTQQVIGLGISQGGTWNPRHLRVTSADGQRAIVIDRWE
jgi:hypothetical protein